MHSHTVSGHPGAKYFDGTFDRDFVFLCPELIQWTGISGWNKYLTFLHIQLQTIQASIGIDLLSSEGIKVVPAVCDCSDIICNVQ